MVQWLFYFSFLYKMNDVVYWEYDINDIDILYKRLTDA